MVSPSFPHAVNPKFNKCFHEKTSFDDHLSRLVRTEYAWKWGCMKVWQHLSGVSFPFQVDGDCTTYCASSKMWLRIRQGRSRPAKHSQSFLNYFQKDTDLAEQCLITHLWEEWEIKTPRGKLIYRKLSHKAQMAHLRTLDTLLAESVLDPGLLIPFPLLSHACFFFLSFFPLSSLFLFILLLFIIIIMCNLYINFHV